jgi:hypothetical protein
MAAHMRFDLWDAVSSPRIEESAFSSYGFETIVIPNGIRFIDGSDFANCSLKLLSISPDLTHFGVFGSFLADRSRYLIVRSFGSIDSVVMPLSVTHLCKFCFSNCRSLSSISFESGSNLQRIEESAFYYSGLTTIIIPSSVTLLCKSCDFYPHMIANALCLPTGSVSSVGVCPLHLLCTSLVSLA